MKKSIVLLLMLFSLTWLAAQTTGKIKGVVKDDGGDPLPGAFVTIEGTTMGSQTDENGYYYIIGVRAGTYSLKCQFVGFKPAEKKGVSVKVGLTTTADFKMASSDMVMKTLEVTVDREEAVNKSETSGKRNVSSTAIDAIATADISNVATTQAGVTSDASGGLHFRGGRDGEVGFMIDGIATGDPTSNRTASSVSINFANVESFSIQKGVSDAEYGDALSGNINIVMKVGDQQKTGVFAKYTTDAFMGDNKFDYHGSEFSINGPLPFTSGMEIRPTYFLSTDFSTQNGFKYSYRRPGTSSYYSFADDDVTGFGFDMPIKRENNFNITFKTAFDITRSMKLSTTFQKSRSIDYGYNHYLRYSPESANKNVEDVTQVNVNFNHVLNQESFYDLVFSVYNREFESLPMGKTPDKFVNRDSVDFFSGYDIYDYNKNGIRDGGNYEGFIDSRYGKLACFDREFFVDLDGDGNWESGEPFADINSNGVWDGDILYDSNGNKKWDYWENNTSYDGFISGTFKLTYGGETPGSGSDAYPEGMSISHVGSIATLEYVEPYMDRNFNGNFDTNIYLSNDNDGLLNDLSETFNDGDLFNDTGEPFVDWLRLEVEDGKVVLRSNGRHDPIKYQTIGSGIDGSIPDSIFNVNGSFAGYTIDDFMWKVQMGPGENNVIKVTYTYNPDTKMYKVTYPPEPFLDLPSTLGSQVQTNLRLNQTYNPPNDKMDEFEAYMHHKSIALNQINSLGYRENGGIVTWEGSYSTYKGLSVSELLAKNENLTQIKQDTYSTWVDRNGNNHYDESNSKYDSGEDFADHNKDGKWNPNDLFANPGTIRNPTYSYRNNTIYKLKGNYSNMLDKFNMLKAGFEFTLNDLDYLEIEGVHISSNPLVQYPGAYSAYGDNRVYYRYKPVQFSAYIQDKMEFEDLVISAGVRLDSRYLNDDIKKDYELRQEAKVPGYEEEFEQAIIAFSPRFGVSHSISESAKLYFGYGHFNQLPNYTTIFDPNTTDDANSVFGNMNLGYERNVQYELGVMQEFGDYLIDVSTYFKDVYDMLTTKKYEDAYGNKRNVWINNDYGKSRGIEVSLDKNLRNNITWNVSYALSYAYGKSSDADDNTTVDEKDIKTREYPLNWDERHVVNAGVSVIYGDKDFIAEIPFTNNWTVSLTNSFNSGKPFTPTEQYYEDSNGNKTKFEKDIDQNSERLPWTSNSNLHIDKSFRMASGDGENMSSFGTLKFAFDIENLFDKVNVQQVYANTGSAFNPGKIGDDNQLVLFPNRAENFSNPLNVSERRSYKFSVSYNW